jgi:hypothetical protein
MLRKWIKNLKEMPTNKTNQKGCNSDRPKTTVIMSWPKKWKRRIFIAIKEPNWTIFDQQRQNVV